MLRLDGGARTNEIVASQFPAEASRQHGRRRALSGGSGTDTAPVGRTRSPGLASGTSSAARAGTTGAVWRDASRFPLRRPRERQRSSGVGTDRWTRFRADFGDPREIAPPMPVTKSRVLGNNGASCNADIGESSAAMSGTCGNERRRLLDAAARDDRAPIVVETGGTRRYVAAAARALRSPKPCEASALGDATGSDSTTHDTEKSSQQSALAVAGPAASTARPRLATSAVRK